MAMFEARLNTMVMWFDQWNESGQTVALFKMLTRLAPTQARFVSIALEYSLTECTELALQEQEANNPGFVSGLMSESKEVAMTQLLLHLPLLRPGNQEAKSCYLTVVPMMLHYSMETGCFVEEARQLLAYVLIHPAFKNDRRSFEPWRKSLGEKIMNSSKNLSSVNTAVTSSSSVGGGICGVGIPGSSNGSIAIVPSSQPHSQQKNRQQRSNSLTPPFGVTPPSELCTSQDDISVVVRGKNRRFSLSDHSSGPPLSPQSQTSSGSGSETHLDDLKFPHGYNSPGMRDVQGWLKALRLHKYSGLFYQLTYEQMLSLTEETFDATIEQIGAGPAPTQGARRKILLSISKLRDRYSGLCQLEQEVISGGNLLNAMDMLNSILKTPIKPASNDDECASRQTVAAVDDIPAQFTKVLGKVCTQLMVSGRGDDEALSRFISLLDSAYHHDAFTSQQKRKISSWRLQICQQQRQMRPDQPRYAPQNVFLHPSAPIRATVPGARFPSIVSPTKNTCSRQVQFLRNSITLGTSCTNSIPNTGSSGCGMSAAQHLQHNVSASGTSVVVGSGVTNNAASVFHAKRPSLQDHPLLELSGETHVNVQRAQSAPNAETDPELNSRLESLCLRMTEQALGGPSEM